MEEVHRNYPYRVMRLVIVRLETMNTATREIVAEVGSFELCLGPVSSW